MNPAPTAPRILVLGASGYTGRLVARRLAGGRRPFLLSARDPQRLARLAEDLDDSPAQPADVTDAAALRRLLRAGDVVINCVGPFTELGEPVVRACIDAGAHYLDTTGEQRFMRRILDRYHDAAAERGVAVVNAMAFEFALGDAAAALATGALAGDADSARLRSVDVTYAIRAGAGSASRGTQRSMLRILAGGGYVRRDGRLRCRRAAGARRAVELPDGRVRPAIAFPAGEVLTVPRHVDDVPDVAGWIVVSPATARLASTLSPVLPLLARAAIPLADRLLGRKRDGPDAAQRDAGEFLIMADARSARGAGSRAIVRGRDPYGVTAAIVLRGATRLLDGADDPARDAAPAGVLPPAAVVAPRRLLDGLADDGIEWEVLAPRHARTDAG